MELSQLQRKGPQNNHVISVNSDVNISTHITWNITWNTEGLASQLYTAARMTEVVEIVSQYDIVKRGNISEK